MSEPTQLPDVATILAGVLQRVPPDQAPLVIAIAERMAAERYRGWAAEYPDRSRAAGFLDCAQREEEIARCVESLFAGAEATQAQLRAANPDLDAINAGLFAGRPLAQQLEIQAGGERLGAATWRALATKSESAGARQIYLDCALLEEASAEFLESLLSVGGGSV